MLRVSVDTVDRLANRRLLRRYRVGGRVLFRLSEVLAYVEGNRDDDDG